MKCVIFSIFVIIAVALAAPQGKAAKTCNNVGGFCQVTEQCCPNLVCLTYAAKCVTKGGVIVPEQYNRPLIRSSNVPKSELP